MAHAKPNPSELPLLLKASQLMALLKFSKRTLWRMNHQRTGEMPAAVKVVGTRWIRAEIEEWLRERMPSLVGDRLRYRGKGLNLHASTPTLLTTDEAASLLGFSRRSLIRLDSSKKIFAPIRGRGTRWMRDEIEAWVDLGCPPRQNDSKRAS